MTEPTPDPQDERIRAAAAAWIVRIEQGATSRVYRNLERWRAADPRHDATYQLMARRFDDARVLRGSRRFAARPQAARRPARVVIAAGALAAVVLLLILLLPTLRSQTIPADRQGRAIASATSAAGAARRHVTAPGAIDAIGLGDGSVVTLDAGSAIDVAFSADARHVTLLRGHARFEVAHDGRPFTVLAGGGSVIARGTIFDVSLDPRGHVAVALLRGMVDVLSPATPTSPAPRAWRLAAGEGAGFAPATPAVSDPVRVADTHWADRATDFDAVSLGYLLDRANQGPGSQIGVADPSLLQLLVSGRFDLGDREHLARNLARLLDLRIHFQRDAIVLSRP